MKKHTFLQSMPPKHLYIGYRYKVKTLGRFGNTQLKASRLTVDISNARIDFFILLIKAMLGFPKQTILHYGRIMNRAILNDL